MNPVPPVPPQHLGKYRGVVKNNLDPEQLGRIQAIVPSLSSNVLGWAVPCTPYPAGVSSLAVPPIGTQVWIEFEGGDLGLPVWTGCYWIPGEPALLQPPE